MLSSRLVRVLIGPPEAACEGAIVCDAGCADEDVANQQPYLHLQLLCCCPPAHTLFTETASKLVGTLKAFARQLSLQTGAGSRVCIKHSTEASQ
jgi:hypothetical protein